MTPQTDIAIIGAGPSGAYCAWKLAQAGVRVTIFEEHSKIGEPRHCTGILGREAYDRFPDLPKTMIQSTLRGACIVSPSGERVRTSWFNEQAYVIHRSEFDQELVRRAVEAGAALRTACPVQDIFVQPDGVTLRVGASGEERFTASAVVIAAGISYRFHQPLGLPVPTAMLQCAQTEVESLSITETEVYIGQNVAPGSFAWAVPVGNGRLRVGVTAHRLAAAHLEKLFESDQLRGRVKRQGEPVRKRPVPIRPVSRSVSDRVVLVGDAAGHVKPTTGGGIFYGIIGASLAAETLGLAVRENDFREVRLRAYDRAWRKALNPEMWKERMCRAIFERFNDARLDKLVHVCSLADVSQNIQKNAAFDWHAKTVFSFLSSPRVLSQLF